MEFYTFASIAAVIISIGVGLANFFDRKESKAGALAELKTGMTYNQQTLDEIKSDIKEMKGSISFYSERLTAVEQSAKSAHLRIDTLEKNKGAKS